MKPLLASPQPLTPLTPPCGRAPSALALAATLLLATFSLAGCSQGGAGGPPPDLAVEVVIGQPKLIPVEETLTAVGTIEANESVSIQPKVPGLVEAISFTEGEAVSGGQQLFAMDARTEAAAVAQAGAELQLAESNLARARTLIGTLAVSQQELDQLESLVAVKTALLKTAQERLAERTILAPFDGTVGPRLVSPGQYVNAGTPLVTLVDDARVKARFRIPERQLAQVREGQEARLRVSTWPDRTFVGRVDLIAPVVDPATRTAEVRLIAANPDRLLRPGMFARVEVVVQTRPGSLVLSESALVPALDRFSVYVVQGDRVQLRPVALGVRLPGQVEIREGLTAESRVVLRGTQKLVDGMRVTNAPPATPQPAPAATATPSTTRS